MNNLNQFNKVKLTKMKLIKLIITILAIWPIAYLPASEKFCTPSNDCFVLQNIEPQIYLIGQQHDEKWVNFQIETSKLAIQKKLVNIQESVSNDSHTLNTIANRLGYNSSGYLFGMEDPLVNFLCDLVFEYSLLYMLTIEPESVPAHVLDIWSKRVANSKGQVLGQLVLDHKAEALWKEFRKSNAINKLNKNIVSAIDEMLKNKNNVSQATAKAFKKISLFEEQWLDLFRHFALYILDNHIAKLPLGLQPDIEKIRDFFNDPLNSEYMVYIRFDVNTYWRGIFIQKNIEKAFNYAQKVKKPLFILIGQDQFEDIKSFLQRSNYPFKAYPFSSLYNEELARKVLELEGNENMAGKDIL